MRSESIELIHSSVMNKINSFIAWESDEVYVLIALSRKKYNDKLTSSNDSKKMAIFREVCTQDNISERALKLLTLITNYNNEPVRSEDFNLYIQVNPRSIRKGIRNLKNYLTEWDYLQDYTKAERLSGKWCSCVQKKSARSRRLWYIVDIDTDGEQASEIIELFDKFTTESFLSFETRNGYHLLSPPFNVQKFNKLMKEEGYSDLVETKTDDCLNLWCGVW